MRFISLVALLVVLFWGQTAIFGAEKLYVKIVDRQTSDTNYSFSRSDGRIEGGDDENRG